MGGRAEVRRRGWWPRGWAGRGRVSQKSLQSGDLWGPQGRRRGSILRPDAPKLAAREKDEGVGHQEGRGPETLQSRNGVGRGVVVVPLQKEQGDLPPGVQPEHLPPSPCLQAAHLVLSSPLL